MAIVEIRAGLLSQRRLERRTKDRLIYALWKCKDILEELKEDNEVSKSTIQEALDRIYWG